MNERQTVIDRLWKQYRDAWKKVEEETVNSRDPRDQAEAWRLYDEAYRKFCEFRDKTEANIQ